MNPIPPRRPSAGVVATLAAAFLAVVLGLGLGFNSPSRGASPRVARPNFVVIMFDDLGFSDLGCFGGEIQTPNIDKLAEGGLRFQRFYNASRCCPSRASFLTGLYPHQVGLAGNGRDLSRDAATLAEHLRSAGYQTAMAGKWHLSATKPLGGGDRSRENLAWLNHQGDRGRPFADPSTYPIHRGFDRHYGPIWGVVDYFDPFSLVDGTRPVVEVPKDYYLTDAITSRVVDSIRAMAARRDSPFFLYVAHCAPHWPLHARPVDIARYRGKYDQGWHALREARYARQLAMGLIHPKAQPLPPLMGRGPDWDALTPDQRHHQASLMEVHAAMVDRVDRGVGAIVEVLQEANQFDNTVILILSDNGASPERYLEPGFDRPSETREGEAIQYRGTFQPGSETTWGYIGPYWANALNTPYRYWKQEAFEGGCHTPLIVHWPGGLKTLPGATTDQVGHVIDLAPTCLDLAGAAPLKTLDGRRLKPIEGKTLAPIFEGKTREGHEALFFEHEGGRAVLGADGWKLVASSGNPWELYHVAEDATETRNLADQHPERVSEMGRIWLRWAERVEAPIPKTPR